MILLYMRMAVYTNIALAVGSDQTHTVGRAELPVRRGSRGKYMIWQNNVMPGSTLGHVHSDSSVTSHPPFEEHFDEGAEALGLQDVLRVVVHEVFDIRRLKLERRDGV